MLSILTISLMPTALLPFCKQARLKGMQGAIRMAGNPTCSSFIEELPANETFQREGGKVVSPLFRRVAVPNKICWQKNETVIDQIAILAISSINFLRRRMGSNIHTIVIGSGISGMAAANTIARQGHEVLVLEAGNYIGGRTKSVGVPLANNTTFAFDEGASWIHGCNKDHPIQHLANAVGTKIIETEDDSNVNYDLNGEECGDKTAKAYQKYEKFMEKAGDMEGISLENALNKMDPGCLKDKYFMYNISNDIEFQTSGSIVNMSAEHAQDDSEYEGKEMLVTSGYQSIPTFLSQDKNIKVLLNHQVIEIIKESNGKSMVKCTNGDTFEAPNVVISVPLGILKMNAIRFTPDLPPWKRQAINQIQFGNVCKVLIVLKGKPIDTKEHYIGVIQDDVSKRGLATYFLNLWGVAGLPALMTFGLGANAEDIESMPEPQLKELIASRFRVFADESFTANDFDIYRTFWRHNPNFRGAYSYPGITTKPEHWQSIAKPIFNCNWHFCGEHTHSNYRGTVHGAYLSGLDSADAILRNLNEHSWVYKGKEEDSSQSQGEKGQKGGNKQGKEESSESQEDKGKKKQKSEKKKGKEQSSESQEDKGKKKQKKEKKKGKNESSSQSEQDKGKKKKGKKGGSDSD